jgi:hypothetical protein
LLKTSHGGSGSIAGSVGRDLVGNQVGAEIAESAEDDGAGTGFDAASRTENGADLGSGRGTAPTSDLTDDFGGDRLDGMLGARPFTGLFQVVGSEQDAHDSEGPADPPDDTRLPIGPPEIFETSLKLDLGYISSPEILPQSFA